jgi:hypothetical protein
VYRGDLKSPSTAPTEPTVEELTAEPGPSRVWADWEVSLGEETKGGITVPIEIWPQGSPADSTEKTGQNTVTFTGLNAGITYVVDLFGTQATAETKNAPADASVIGYATADGKYTYEYEVKADGLQSWTDHFGGSHSSDSATVTSSEAVSEHAIGLTWDNESRERRLETRWRLPPDPVSFARSAKTGQAVLAAQAEPPVFYARRFSGSREVQLAYNTYPAGNWEACPVGYLPLSAEGELEDYVSATLIGPGGTPMGQSVGTKRPTEMAVRLTIEAAGSLSPIVYGARVEQSS